MLYRMGEVSLNFDGLGLEAPDTSKASFSGGSRKRQKFRSQDPTCIIDKVSEPEVRNRNTHNLSKEEEAGLWTLWI